MRITARMLVCGLLAVPSGCADDGASMTAPAEVVFVDLETKQPVLAPPAGDVPAPHPETGRRTLMPGLYCAHCQAWHAAPPLEELQRNPEARKCPVCGGAQTAEGPVP
jgi:hypothetical protein